MIYSSNLGSFIFFVISVFYIILDSMLNEIQTILNIKLEIFVVSLYFIGYILYDMHDQVICRQLTIFALDIKYMNIQGG